MTYNIHPIFVHFPIALLLIYSIIKILPFKKWFPDVSWKHIEVVLLGLGVFGAFVASSTGEIAEHLTRLNRQLVEMHSTFASISTWLYGLLLLGEFLYLLTPYFITKFNSSKIVGFLLFVQKILINNVLSKIMAFLGLIAISTTGLLGGVMVFGTSSDPLASIVLNILGLNF
ncbi:hypothetical protein COX93_01240 [Candidatus Nomurabacteria bacterium CG_4_10_14_0_2_um_filter_30_12]|uniref:DUF2231 domain-containing protein n=1 Tax=Candidatus Nomurabacteria bacterium CG_4_10_14_0_2_um_filter_30_12 TaxID=1974727 RepID=A0A2J0MJQ1_9BACT|nr:MAG: hypothetical protein COX93_01240 [Candidatus Nomurabacteria bacterium CG_4_10_14_0_2_um_filter_30_12]